MFKDGLENDGSHVSYWDTTKWVDAQNSNPDIVTIMLGTNDSKLINWGSPSRGDQFALDYVDMISILNDLPSEPKIFVMIPPPLFEPYPFQMQKDVINTIYPVLDRVIASWQNVGVIDNYSILEGTNLSIDGCHPNDAGHDLIAHNVAAAITAEFGVYF